QVDRMEVCLVLRADPALPSGRCQVLLRRLPQTCGAPTADEQAMTGADLKEARREMHWSQRELARRAEIDRTTVQYWESKAEVDPRSWAMSRIAKAFGWRDFRTPIARTRHGVLDRETDTDFIKRFFSGSTRATLLRIANRRVICGARTRKGTQCRAKSEPGKKRCRLHGGLSTGPKTEEGRQRIAEAQRRR
ncbi:HGGxSTG domain-containing protein, partial [Tropicimonas aquimaris]